MKNYTVLVKAFKYGKYSGKFAFSEYVIFEAENKEDAKSIAREFTNSTIWAMDITAYADLRTLKPV